MSFFLPFIAIALLLVTIIVALDCIWRVEDRLDRFLKLILIGLVFLLMRKALMVFDFEQFAGWQKAMEGLDIASALFFLLAFAKMFSLVRFLDGEKTK